jgi:hypothetical protein
VEVLRDELAEEVLAGVMSWEPAQLAEHGSKLQLLARLKYDDYEGFRPGEKFLENLARWLSQFEPEERRLAIRFVLEELIFISRAEMEHAIELVYPDFLRPFLRETVAAELGVTPYKLTAVVGSKQFAAHQRKVLILGLADGARLDRLRRACPELSHEQFCLIPDASDDLIRNMAEKLSGALSQRDLPGPSQFQHVLLVDDFTGTGFTLIRRGSQGLDGKLARAKLSLDKFQDLGALATPATVNVLVYVGSEQAEVHVKDHLREAGLEWHFDAVQRIPKSCRVTNATLRALCKRYYDPVLDDVHKGSPIYGYHDAALPLVLSHNTPNDSIAIIWADTSERDGSLQRCALFPRYERHHVDRP